LPFEFIIMIQLRTILNVADNSGAKLVRVIKVYGGSRRRYAGLGDIVLASIRKAEPRKSVKKGEMVKGVVVRVKSPHRRKDGSYVRFDDNAFVLLDGLEPKGGRIFGPIAREIKEKGFVKIATLAEELV